MKELEYPFDSEYILKKSKKIKRQLLESGQAGQTAFLQKKIAVLGGSTTHDIIRVLEVFLLHHGIEPVFYESEYAQYWQDVMFDNPELTAFAPDLIYIHTSNRNITAYPSAGYGGANRCPAGGAVRAFQGNVGQDRRTVSLSRDSE